MSQWQRDFNSIADDMREDEDTKEELHLRLDVRRICNMLQHKYSKTVDENRVKNLLKKIKV